MVGFYTFPKPMDFISIGNLGFGAALSFNTFPPTPDSIRAGGAICLSRNKESGRGGCHIKDGYIENDKYDCNNEFAPCIAGAVQLGIDKSDPEGTYLFLQFSGTSVRNILFIAGMENLDSVPSIFSEMSLTQAKLSYSPAGLAPDNPVLVELGIDVPEGFKVEGDVTFLGAKGYLRAQMNSEYFEGEISLDPIENFAGIMNIRRGKDSSVKNWDKGMFVKAYAGWTPNTFQGNGDWCPGAFCAKGAGYVEIPLIGSEGGFMFDMSVGASCGSKAASLCKDLYMSPCIASNTCNWVKDRRDSNGAMIYGYCEDATSTAVSVGGGAAGSGCGIDITYEMRGQTIFGGALVADMMVRTKVDPAKPEEMHFKGSINIRTNNLFLKIVNALFKVVRPIYDGLKVLINGVKYMLELAEEFIDKVFNPIDDSFAFVERTLASAFTASSGPFDAAMRKVRGVKNKDGSRNICDPVVDDVFLQIEPQHRQTFVEMVQDYDRRHGHPLWKPSADLWAGKPRVPALSLKDIHISADEAKSFLQTKQGAKFGKAKEWAKERANEVAEKAAEIAYEIKAQAECIAFNAMLMAASVPLLALWTPVQAVQGLRQILRNINPASIILNLVDEAEKGIENVFEFLMDAMNEDNTGLAALMKIAEIMNKIFSLQELSGMLELTPQSTTLEIGVLATIFSKMVDFKFSVTLNQGNMMKAFIDEIVLKHIIPFFAPGVFDLRDRMDALFGTIEAEFQAVMDAANDGVEEVTGWVDEVKGLLQM